MQFCAVHCTRTHLALAGKQSNFGGHFVTDPGTDIPDQSVFGAHRWFYFKESIALVMSQIKQARIGGGWRILTDLDLYWKLPLSPKLEIGGMEPGLDGNPSVMRFERLVPTEFPSGILMIMYFSVETK